MILKIGSDSFNKKTSNNNYLFNKIKNKIN